MHRFDPISFAFGLVFLGAAAIAWFDLPADLGRWMAPAALIGVGVAIAAATITAER